MSKVIDIKNLSKIYDLGLVGTGTLYKDLNRLWAKVIGKTDPYATLVEINDRTQKSASNSVYALRDINFSVEQGEILGVIGSNGAGKSTLLKILSQITSPSSGSIKMKGRVASLLEVGTGMHPEMTARQNVYLNGSLMGMNRDEVRSKLNEIIEFAGVEKYIDTPIKRFSSGMKVRLGFAVAAFLEPEILIVDEVLAVGDAEFQKKAIGKMQDVSSGGGRTVLFVSHNMGSIKALCTKAIEIQNGQISQEGNVNEVVDNYLSNQIIDNCDLKKRKGNQKIKTRNITILNSSKKPQITHYSDSNMIFKINFDCSDNLIDKKILVILNITNRNSELVYQFRSDEVSPNLSIKSNKIIELNIPKLSLRPGQFQASLRLAMNSFNEEDMCDYIDNCISFEVISSDFFNSGKTIKSGHYGVITGNFIST